MRTFLASSKEIPVSLLMSCAIMVATPTAELPAPKKMMRASFSGVCWAFMPLMKLQQRCVLLGYCVWMLRIERDTGGEFAHDKSMTD